VDTYDGLHTVCSDISDVVKDLLPVIPRMRTIFEGESLRAMLSGLKTVSGKRLCRSLLMVRKRRRIRGVPIRNFV
jgi:hypothetical protein